MRLAPALPLAVAIILSSATVPNTTAAPDAQSATGVTSLLLDSEPGEFLGGGEFNFYTPDDGVLAVAPYHPTTPGDVYLNFSGRGTSWNLEFTAAEGESLAVGAYEDAIPPYRREPGQPGLQIDGGAGGCVNTFGRFEVKQVAFGADDTLTAFWATFEQTCAGKVLRGEVRLNADVPVVVVAPSHRTVQERHEMSFAVEAHDSSGAPAVLSATGAPAGASFTDAGDGTGRFTWTAEVGQEGRYWVAFRGQGTGGESDSVYTRLEAIPDFDDFDHAIPIPALPYRGLVESPEASAAADDPVCQGPSEATIWYSFTATADEHIRISAFPEFPFPPGGTHSAVVSVYEGERGALRQIACDSTQTRAIVVAGRTYHIMLGLSIPVPHLRLFVDVVPPPPPNDAFEAATVVPALPFDDTVEAASATFDIGDPETCGFNQFGPNFWYTYTPAQRMRITVDSSAMAFGQITAFRGARGSLVTVACDISRIRFTAEAGQPYHVMFSALPVFGPIGGSTSIPVQVSFAGRPALGIDVVLARDGVVDPRTGTAVVHGTATCSRPAQIVVHGTLYQGRDTMQGNFDTTIACTGVTAWRAEVAADPRRRRAARFTSGRALAALHASGVSNEDPGDTAVDDDPGAPIALKIARPR